MTTITQTWTNTCAFCDKVGLYLKKLLARMQYARQMQANRRVAQDLMNLGFNDGKEMRHILTAMNDKTNAEYHSRY